MKCCVTVLSILYRNINVKWGYTGQITKRIIYKFTRLSINFSDYVTAVCNYLNY